jgi:hypothetical protein
MNLLRHTSAALAVAGLLAVTIPSAHADEWDKKTIMTINEAIQLPTMVLQPGTYTFKLLDSASDRHIVQIFDKDNKHLITTMLAIPNYRLQPTGKSVFAFWETPAGNPPALRAWFYPGDNFGQEFAYPKNASMSIAAANKASVPSTTAQSAEDMKSSSVSAINENGQQSELDSKAYTKPAEEPVAAAPAPAPQPPPSQDTTPQTPQAIPAPEPPPAPEPQVAPISQELPHTASQMPLVGLIGLLSFGAALALGRAKRVR